jgi:hypothetical protein
LVCLGPDQREDILPEARSERIKVRRGKIRGNIYFLKPDQRVYGYLGARSEGVKPMTSHIKAKIDLSGQTRGYV